MKEVNILFCYYLSVKVIISGHTATCLFCSCLKIHYAFAIASQLVMLLVNHRKGARFSGYIYIMNNDYLPAFFPDIGEDQETSTYVTVTY